MKYSTEYWNDVALVIEHIPNVHSLYGKRFLITGATGMVCSSVVDVISYLNRMKNAGIYLTLAGRSKERIKRRFEGVLEESEFDYINFDATKSQSIDVSADFILYGASNANPAIYAKQPVETLLGNILGLSSALETARKNYDSRLLYISSSEVYGNRIDGGNVPYREDDYGFVDLLNPRACYPNGKRAGETLCSCYGQEFGVDFVIARLGHIYGPSITQDDTRASAAFTRDVVNGRNIVMKSAGVQLRSYCYTLDCASAIMTVLLEGMSGQAYNVSNRDSVVSIRDMAEALAKVGGVKVVYENSSEIERKNYNLMSNSVLNAEKLEALGWKASYNLLDGVRKTLEYY